MSAEREEREEREERDLGLGLRLAVLELYMMYLN